MPMLKFTPDHEWLSVDGDIATVGITSYAQEQLGDVVFVELPAPGKQVTKGVAAAVVESNKALVAEPALVNSEPMGKGWFFKIKIAARAELDGLMDEVTYNSQRA